MKSFIRKIVLAAVCALSMNAANAGIPVVTAISDVQHMITQIANYAQYIEQVMQLKNQLQQAEQQFNALTGPRGMANLLSSTQLYQQFSSDYASLSSSIKGSGSYSSARAALPTNADPKINAIYDAVAVNKAALTDAYATANSRLSQVQQLQAQIDSAYDPAAKADLQNRMVSELNSIQATSQMLSVLKPQQEQDVALATQEAHRSYVCSEFKNTGC